MIKELRNNDREWLWRNSTESRGVYYTDKNGEGIFFQSDRTGQTIPLPLHPTKPMTHMSRLIATPNLHKRSMVNGRKRSGP